MNSHPNLFLVLNCNLVVLHYNTLSVHLGSLPTYICRLVAIIGKLKFTG